jgi:hypothetical protein
MVLIYNYILFCLITTNGVENPELNLKTNVNNTIQIQNPTDTKQAGAPVMESQMDMPKGTYDSPRSM